MSAFHTGERYRFTWISCFIVSISRVILDVSLLFFLGGGASSFMEYSLTDITSICLHVLGSLVEMFLGNAKLT